MSFGLGTSLNQSQKLTPQMQQAIKLLQMSSLELEQEVQAKLDSNPLLERISDDDELPSDSPNSDDINAWESKSSSDASDDGFGDYDNDADSLDKIDSHAIDDDAMDTTWQEVYGDDVDVNYGDTSLADDNLDNQGATSLCIQDHVRWQMEFKHLSDLDRLIAEHLIDAMDDLGFVRIELDEVVKSFATVLSFYELEDSIGIEEVQAVLKMIQSCSPTGVGARDLSECLSIQLQHLPSDTAYLDEAKAVIASSEHLQSNNIKELVGQTGLDVGQIKQAIALIRTLDPYPGQSFLLDHAIFDNELDVPDILVFAKDIHKKSTTNQADVDSWRVILNPETLPRLKINQEYASLIKRGDDSVDNQYLKDNLNDARLFIRSIEERNQNLLKVASCIVQKQQEFLLKGAMAMRPLTLREVADDVGLHESTVSRLTTNKSMLTPQGIHSLKYFFSSHVSSDDGEVSSTAISAMIEQMIDEENPKKPLSDSEITRRLEEKGMNIARRTVAKYREAMGIAPSSQRKQKL